MVIKDLTTRTVYKGGETMNRFVIGDPKDCIGCNTCMAACSETHKAFGLQSYPRLQVMRNDDITVPILCRHCDDSPCATVCPVHAITHVNDTIQLQRRSALMKILPV